MSTEEKQDCGPLALKSNLVLGPLVEAAGMVNVLNHGSGSCVYSEGCHGVTQEHLERFAEMVRADERKWCDQAMRDALEVAVRQNEHDMLMTGEELRACRAALDALWPNVRAKQETTA